MTTFSARSLRALPSIRALSFLFPLTFIADSVKSHPREWVDYSDPAYKQR
jgi:hypothetical protein